MLWDQQPEGHGTILYGLDRLPTRGTIILRKARVTHIRFGYTALGAWRSSATHFKPERDDRYLKDRDVVVLMESDEGGASVVARAIDLARACSDPRWPCSKASRTPPRCTWPALSASGRIERALGRAVPLERLLKNVPELDRRPESNPAGLPRGYRRRPDGAIEYLDGEDEEGELQWRWLCSPIEFLAVTRRPTRVGSAPACKDTRRPLASMGDALAAALGCWR